MDSRQHQQPQSHSSYCQPTTTIGAVNGGDDFSEMNIVQQHQSIQTGQYNGFPPSPNSAAAKSATGISPLRQNGSPYQSRGDVHGGVSVPSQAVFQPESASKQQPFYQSRPYAAGMAASGFPTSQQTSSYTNITSPPKQFDPFGYKSRSTNPTYLQKQQIAPAFAPREVQQPNFVEVQQAAANSRQFIAGAFPSNSSPLSATPTVASNTNSEIAISAVGNNFSTAGRPLPPPQQQHHHQQQPHPPPLTTSHSPQSPHPFSATAPPPQIHHHHQSLTSASIVPFHSLENSTINNSSPGSGSPFQPQQQQRQQFGPVAFSSQGPAATEFPNSNTFDMPAIIYNDGPMTNGEIQQTQGSAGQPVNGTMGNGGEEFLGEFAHSQEVAARYFLSVDLVGRIETSSKKQALFEVQIGLEQIAFDIPTNFNTWATVIRDRLVGADPLPEAELRIATEILIEMAVVLDESQYNFSCLCQFLGKNIENYNNNVLLPLLSSFINETQSELGPPHCRNLVTFLAELYDKIEINGVKDAALAAHLFEQLETLLKCVPLDDQSISVIVKVLKLVGRFLESNRGSEAMETFLKELEEGAVNATNETTKAKVRNVVELRNKQWGIVPMNGTTTVDSLNSAENFGPEKLRWLRADDDSAFLDDNLDALGNSPVGSLNPMEEDNVEDDYEKFLQETAIRTAEKALEKISIDEGDENVP